MCKGPYWAILQILLEIDGLPSPFWCIAVICMDESSDQKYGAASKRLVSRDAVYRQNSE